MPDVPSSVFMAETIALSVVASPHDALSAQHQSGTSAVGQVESGASIGASDS